MQRLTLDVQYMPSLDEDLKRMSAHVTELKKACSTIALKVRAKHGTADMEMVAKQTLTKRAEHTAQVASLKSDLHKLKAKLDFSKRCNYVADSRFTILCNEFKSRKFQIAIGGL